MSYTDKETYYDPVAKQLKTGADAIWELDSSGAPVGLVGPDGTGTSARTALGIRVWPAGTNVADMAEGDLVVVVA